MRRESTNENGKAPTAPSEGAGAAAGLGVTPAEKVSLGHVLEAVRSGKDPKLSALVEVYFKLGFIDFNVEFSENLIKNEWYDSALEQLEKTREAAKEASQIIWKLIVDILKGESA